MPLVHTELVQPRGVALAFSLETREPGFRTLAFHALEEPVERTLQIDERLLADVCRDLIQPRGLALLQPDQPPLQVAMSGTPAGPFVLALRLSKAPVVHIPARSDTLREKHPLLPARIKLEPVRLLAQSSLRTHVRMLRKRPDTPRGIRNRA